MELEDMLKKLDEFYSKQKVLDIEIKNKILECQQLSDDIELLQMMIMHQTNKKGVKLLSIALANLKRDITNE